MNNILTIVIGLLCINSFVEPLLLAEDDGDIARYPRISETEFAVLGSITHSDSYANRAISEILDALLLKGPGWYTKYTSENGKPWYGINRKGQLAFDFYKAHRDLVGDPPPPSSPDNPEDTVTLKEENPSLVTQASTTVKDFLGYFDGNLAYDVASGDLLYTSRRVCVGRECGPWRKDFALDRVPPIRMDYLRSISEEKGPIVILQVNDTGHAACAVPCFDITADFLTCVNVNHCGRIPAKMSGKMTKDTFYVVHYSDYREGKPWQKVEINSHFKSRNQIDEEEREAQANQDKMSKTTRRLFTPR
jgi:hypothetical protein